MHLQTHILSGWCLANLPRLTPRERLFCMLAAAAPDLDGISHLFGEMAFAEYHHKVGHNLPLAILLAAILAVFTSRPLRIFLVCFAFFHLHLFMDYVGSGRPWTIAYLWPFSNWEIRYRHAWPLYSWQNITAAFIVVLWTLLIAVRLRRTPLEILMPNLDRQLVAWLRQRLTRQPSHPAPSSSPQPQDQSI